MAEDQQLVAMNSDAWLRDANQHDEIAATVSRARLLGPDISAAAESLGPINHQVKAAVAALLPEREAALLRHETGHTELAAIHRQHVNRTNADQETAVANLSRLDPQST